MAAFDVDGFQCEQVELSPGHFQYMTKSPLGVAPLDRDRLLKHMLLAAPELFGRVRTEALPSRFGLPGFADALAARVRRALRGREDVEAW